MTAAPYIWPTFREGLRELGYVEGKNLAIEFRQRKRPKTYLALAKELVQLKVDIILTVGGSATLAAKQATNTIPIVMGNSSSDPVSRGLIDSLARPGGNVTGVIDILPDLAGKRVELLREIFPKLSRIAHLSPDAGSVGPEHLKAVEAAARALGMRVQALKVKGPDDLERAFRAAAKEGAEALIVVGVSFFIPHRPRIVNLEAKYRLPTMHTHTRWVQLGGLISYTTDVNVRYRRAAQYVDKVLKGANPADLPVEQPTKFNLEINLNTAKKLGITIPPSILLRATKVIE
jgi:putative ABC transport system substrate-binding protein